MLLFMSKKNLKLTKRLTCSLLLKVQVQDVRLARWCVRRQLCSSVKWLLIVLSVGSIFRMNALPPHSQSIRGKCDCVTFPVHCSHWPVQRFGYFNLPYIFLAIWQYHIFTLTHFHPANGNRNSFRTLVSGIIKMSHTEVGCVELLFIEMTGIAFTIGSASPCAQVFSRSSVSAF